MDYKRTYSKIIFLSATLIGIILLIIFSNNIFLLIETRKQPVEKLTSSLDITKPSQIAIPELPSELNWRLVDASSQKISHIKWTNQNGDVFGIIPLRGNEWVAYKTVNSESDLINYHNEIHFNFTKDLISSTGISNGWRETTSGISQYNQSNFVECNGYKLFGNLITPDVLNYSYININEKVTVINYYEHSDLKYVLPEANSGYKYPHTREYRIFISDPVLTDTLINNRIVKKDWYNISETQ
jgi:hypothetical protein